MFQVAFQHALHARGGDVTLSKEWQEELKHLRYSGLQLVLDERDDTFLLIVTMSCSKEDKNKSDQQIPRRLLVLALSSPISLD